jgi:hypothetical protein
LPGTERHVDDVPNLAGEVYHRFFALDEKTRFALDWKLILSEGHFQHGDSASRQTGGRFL